MAPGEEVHVKGEKIEWVLADHVGYWRVGSPRITDLYNLVDYFDPYRNPVHDPGSYNFVDSLECGGPAPVQTAIDWSHMSAISEHGNLIITSLRNLNTVVAFWRDNDPRAPGLAWVVSSSRSARSRARAPSLRRDLLTHFFSYLARPFLAAASSRISISHRQMTNFTTCTTRRWFRSTR